MPPPEWDASLGVAAAIGEIRGDVKGLITALTRLGAQIDEHLVADEKAHGRQDDRIVELMEKQAMTEGKHAATIMWIGLVGILLGAVLMALLPDALELAHRHL